jgi:hypothetical protein
MVKELKISDVIIAHRYSEFFRGDTREEMIFAVGLKNTFQALTEAGARVWFVENVPEYSANVTNMLSRQALRGAPAAECGYAVADYQMKNIKPRGILAELRREGMHLLPVEEIICPQGLCLPGDDDNIFYVDEHHLSNYGALKFKQVFAPLFRLYH